jgi:hypothetical protein
MSGDYTRFTHRPERNYSSVLMQQGRVQLDADWNEQSDILQRRLRIQAMDTFGRCAVPEPTTPDAFKLAPLAGPPADLSLGSGRLYLDGLLAEIFAGESHTYRNQKYYPDPPALPASGEAIAYLDVWDREVTYLEDADLLEKALGGPDTTTRQQTVWQVKWHGTEDAQCGSDLDALFPPSGGRATTSAIAPPASNDPCILQPSGGYRGLENRLYRVEVHTRGGLNTARFKWSRDNASIVSRVDAIAVSGTQTVLTVARIGRDKVLRFEVGDWVEVTDDHRELMGEAGEMAQVAATSEAALTVTLDRAIPTGPGRAFGATPAVVQARHTRLRKWNQRAPGNTLDADGLIAIDGTNVHLEDGVYVQLAIDPSGGEFQVGDYWVFATRTADASVEPLNSAPPRGIVHHYCQLATLAWQGTPAALHVHDCRTLWPDPHCCTVSVRPGEDIQRAVDRLPPEGGCVCLLPGIHVVETPILIDARRNILIHGMGRASKVVTCPATNGESVFYVAGASRQIRMHDFLVFSDERASLVTIAEDAREIGLAGMTLIDTASEANSDCVLLAGCSQVTVQGSTLVGRVGVLQADPDGVAAVAAALAALRPAESDDQAGGNEVDEEEEAPIPEAPPLRALAVTASELFVTSAGVDLQNALDGHVRDNIVTSLDSERLGPWRRAAAKEITSAADLHRWLEDALAQLVPVDSLEGLEGRAIGLQACLLEDFDICGNHVAAYRGIRVSFARQVTASANRVLTAETAVLLGHAFACAMRRNRISVAPLEHEAEPPVDIQDALRLRIHTGRVAIVTRFARGLAIESNAIDAPSAIGTTRSGSGTGCGARYPEALLRLLRIGRAWRVMVELGWVLLVIVRGLQAAGNNASTVLEDVQTKADLETLLLEWFLRLLGDPSYVPPFIGRVRIADNRLEVTHFGVFLNQMLSVGGLLIQGNRISGFTRAGVFVHALFSVGLADRYAGWLHCGLQWLIALLRLLRERLAAMLDGEEVVDPAQPAEFTAANVGVTGVSWLLHFCARFCQGGQTPGDSEPGSEPESPATGLKDALDDLLDHLSPAWIEDLVNQSYVIEDNTLRGNGDGIFVGIDGSQVLGNHVDIGLGSTVAFETLVLGAALQHHFEDTSYSDPVLFRSLVDLDRDMLLLSGSQGNWVDPHLDDANFRARLLAVLQDVVAVSSPESPLNSPLVAARDALVAAVPDLDTARQQWPVITMLIWVYLRGYGIVMQGADMVCSGNHVRAWRGCAPVVRRVDFGPQATTADFRRTAFLRVPGVLPAVPAIGGIWQLTNLGGLMEDLLSVFVVDRSQQSSRIALLIWALLSYVALSSVRDRRLTISGNGVEEALAFGIRTLQVGGETELDVLDNLIRDAVRHGICHHEFASDPKDGAGLHAKVHRNSLVRTSRVFRLPASAGNQATGAILDDFASLIWLENAAGRTLMGRNHGDGARLDGQRRAVYVYTTLAGISDNHVQASSQLAFQVLASVGLFTSNMTGPGNSVPASLVQPPNVETL